MWTFLRIAVRNVVRNRRRTLITLAALVVGVGVLVTIRGALDGLQTWLVNTVVDAQTGALQVHRRGYMKNVLANPIALDMPSDEAFLGRIRATPGVKAVTPRLMFGGMLSVGDQTLFLAAQAIDPKTEFLVCPERRATIEGPFGKSDDGIAVTDSLAKGVAGSKDQPAALLAPDHDGALNGENVSIESRLTSSVPGQDKLAVVPFALAQRLLRMDGRATEVAVAIDRIEDAPKVVAALRQKLGPDYEVQTWDELVPFVKDAMQKQNFVLQLIGAVFMMLMLLGVANTMLMSVLERTREVGTMMAVGVRRGRILSLFLLESAVIGLIGGVLGDLVGLGVIGWFRAHPVVVTVPGASAPFKVLPTMTPQYLVIVLAVATVGATIFALYPAWRASRLRPVQALAGQ